MTNTHSKLFNYTSISQSHLYKTIFSYLQSGIVKIPETIMFNDLDNNVYIVNFKLCGEFIKTNIFIPNNIIIESYNITDISGNLLTNKNLEKNLDNIVKNLFIIDY